MFAYNIFVKKILYIVINISGYSNSIHCGLIYITMNSLKIFSLKNWNVLSFLFNLSAVSAIRKKFKHSFKFINFVINLRDSIERKLNQTIYRSKKIQVWSGKRNRNRKDQTHKYCFIKNERSIFFSLFLTFISGSIDIR